MRTWIWISLVGGAVLCGAAALAIKPAARWAMEREAKARHLLIHADEMELGLMHVSLRRVQLGLVGAPAVHLDLDSVEVDLSFGHPRVTKLLTQGGQLVLDGSVDDVLGQLRAWREARPTSDAAETNNSSAGRRVFVRDLDVRWRDAMEPGVEQRVMGFNLEQTEAGLRAGADLVELRAQGLDVQVAGGTIVAKADRNIETLGAAEMRVSFSTQARTAQKNAADAATKTNQAAPGGAAQAAPGSAGQAAPGSADTASQESAETNPLALMLKPHPERTAKLRAALHLVRERVLSQLPQKVGVERLWLTYVGDDDQIRVGPNQLTLQNEPERVVVELTPREKVEGTPLSLKVEMPKTLDPSQADAPAALQLELAGGPIRLSALGVEEGAFGLQNVERTALQGKLTSHLNADCSAMSALGNVTVEGLTLDSPRLSEQLVVFPRMALKGEAQAQTDGSSFALKQVELGLGEARFEGALSLAREGEAAHIVAEARAPLVSCQALVDSAPRGLLGNVERMRFTGTFSLAASIDAKTDDVEHMLVRWNFDNGCKATGVPMPLNPEQFRGLFNREVLGAGGFPMEMEFGPFSRNWTSYENVSPYVEAALLVTEDGRFFRHDGFDDRAIESAIKDNTRAGKFVRGASTISMQLAKNLYLSRDKTLSRKFQEAALTSLLEQNFEKRELLELYVNVVEFGPGIYGITGAARHYFNTTPDALSASQAFFLASVLPNPGREFFAEDGSLRPSTLSHVRRLLQISHKRGRLSDDELAAALLEIPRLGEPRAAPEEEPVEQDEADGPAPEQAASPTAGEHG